MGTMALTRIAPPTASGPGWFVTRYGALAVLRLRSYSGGTPLALPEGFTPTADCTYRQAYGDVNIRTSGNVYLPETTGTIWDTFTYPVA